MRPLLFRFVFSYTRNFFTRIPDINNGEIFKGELHFWIFSPIGDRDDGDNQRLTAPSCRFGPVCVRPRAQALRLSVFRRQIGQQGSIVGTFAFFFV